MTVRNPIIIASPPRSGSTMVAGLLNKHGVWIGEAKVTPHPETNPQVGTENVLFKRLMKTLAAEIGYKNWHAPLPVLTDEQISRYASMLQDLANAIVPSDTPWLIKTSWTLIFAEVWKRAFPEAKWVFLQRRTRDIMGSINRHPVMRKRLRHRHKIREFILALHEKQIELSDGLSAWQCKQVAIDPIANADKKACSDLLSFCEIDVDESVVDGWIDPTRWHIMPKKYKVPTAKEGGKRFQWLARMIQDRGYSIGAEVGCAGGNTTGRVLKWCSHLHLIAVDLWSTDGGIQYKTWNHASLEKKFLMAINEYKNRVTILKDYSWEAAKQVEDGSLDFAFIDADHEYESVVKDIKAWTPKLKPGGTLCGHDTHFEGVMKAITELIPDWVATKVDHVWECKKEDVRC